jgi:histidinol dehydrogenase
VRAGLETAIANVRAVAEADLGADVEVALPQGQTVTLRDVPVGRAAIYVPGGRAPYPSTVVMGVVTARAAGVGQVVVCAPGAHPVILASCALCGADAVFSMGGAHAVAALAFGTETVPRADVIAGPGNLYVQEAKRLVSGRVGIDGFAGPSDVVVLASAGADPGLVSIDLAAQAEHGTGTVVCAVSPDPQLLDAVEVDPGDAVAALVDAPDLETALAFAEAFAPEHLELVGAEAEALAPRVRNAGALFVGRESGTAFGDYVAGSNHTLPTSGAARFASQLGPRHFRRRMSEVRIGPAAGALARAAAPVARAEGFEVHAASMEVRENGPT